MNLDANRDDCSDEQVKQVTNCLGLKNMHNGSIQAYQNSPVKIQIKIL